MDSVPPELDFSIQRDNIDILTGNLKGEGYWPSPFFIYNLKGY